ncbi:MAG: threonine/serine dehydratase [Pseudomonadales bacterium]
MTVDRTAVLAAARRIEGHIRYTPVRRHDALDRLAGGEVFFKCENLQVAGAFKARGAMHALLCTDRSTLAHGVATHSSGNHGAALAFAAARLGIAAHVVVPAGANPRKREAIRQFGATVVDCGPTLAEREAALAGIVEQTGAHIVPPYDDDRIIAGQGTAALELVADVPGLSAVWVPVGGGGLVAGCVVALAGSGVTVVGAEPELAGDAALSLRTGIRQPPFPPRTIADGLRTCLGERNFAICRDHKLAIHLVTETAIEEAQAQLTRYLSLPVEPSSAVPFAAVCAIRPGGRVGIILSGGNVDASS